MLCRKLCRKHNFNGPLSNIESNRDIYHFCDKIAEKLIFWTEKQKLKLWLTSALWRHTYFEGKINFGKFKNSINQQQKKQNTAKTTLLAIFKEISWKQYLSNGCPTITS